MAWWNPKTWKVFRKTEYLEGSHNVQSSWVKDRIRLAIKPQDTKGVISRDKQYRALDFNHLRRFTAKYHKSMGHFIYHELSDEFPDCDDAALQAQADIILGSIRLYIAQLSKSDLTTGAIKEGFDYFPAFGEISYYSKTLQGYHRANIAVDNQGSVHIYEPQSQKWKTVAEEVDMQNAYPRRVTL